MSKGLSLPAQSNHPSSMCLESIRRILTPLEIRTCFRLHRTLRQALVNLKDRISLQQRAGVVYRIPCGTCPRVYVGQTCRTLDHRLKEHERALTSGNLAQSAVAKHAAHESHAIDWKEAKVVDNHPRYHQRCALESWHIRSKTTTMNRDGSLPQAYNTLLNYTHEPHTSIFNCILSPTTSQPLILIPLHHHIYYPKPSLILFYPSQSFNPKPCMFCKHTQQLPVFLPTLFSRRPLPPYLCI